MAKCKIGLQFEYFHQQWLCLLNKAESMPAREPGDKYCGVAHSVPVLAITQEFTSQIYQLVQH